MNYDELVRKTIHAMSDDHRRHAWWALRWGGIMVLVSLGTLAATYALWGEPIVLRGSDWIWDPIDWYGVGHVLLVALLDFGGALFFWAVASYFIDFMARRQITGFRLLRLIYMAAGFIGLFYLCGFVGAVIFTGRAVYVSAAALVAGWPGGEVREMFIEGGGTVDVAFARDGSAILATSTGENGGRMAWDAYGAKRVAVPPATPRGLATARARKWTDEGMRLTTPDGQTVLEVEAGFGKPGDVIVRDGQGKELRRLLSPREYLKAVAITPDGKRALTGTDEKIVRLWDVDTAKVLFALQGHDDGVSCVQFAPGGHVAFSGDKQGRMLAWDLKEGRRIAAFGGVRKHKEVWFLAVSADGRRLLSTGQQEENPSDQSAVRRSNVCLWNVETGDLLGEFNSEYDDADGQAALSPNGRWAVTAKGMVYLWRLKP